MEELSEKDLKTIQHLYASYYQSNGDTGRGVGWENEQGQRMRFELFETFLKKAISHQHKQKEFSLLDVGAGLGHLELFLKEKEFNNINYRGIDIQKFYVKKAWSKNLNIQLEDFITETPLNESYDFVIMSGAFNLKTTDLIAAIKKMAIITKKGFAFNFIKQGEYALIKSYPPEEIEKVLSQILNIETWEKIEGYIPIDCTYYVWMTTER